MIERPIPRSQPGARLRHLHAFSDRAAARRFADVLVAEGVEATVRDDEDPQDAAVWVHDDARLDDARALLAVWLADPKAERFADASAKATARRREAAAKDERFVRRQELARRSIHGAGAEGWVTRALLLGMVLVAALSGIGADTAALEPLLLTTWPIAAALPEVRAGEVWRLFTPVLVHWGALHLLFNGSMMWSFGQALEQRKGAPFFTLLVVVSGVGSNLAEFAWHWFTDPGAVMLLGGMSGVLYALFGYAWTKGRIDPADGVGVNDRTVQLLIGWLLVCMTGLLGPVANAAHVGGLLIGVLWAGADLAWFKLRKGR
jgi:GlpG protein